MFRTRGESPLGYRHLRRSEFAAIAALEFEHGDVEQFLGPVADIVAAARGGLSHAVVAIEAADRLVGFYVIHPALDDAACWWLGWFAVDRAQRGKGYGALAMDAILQHLQTIPRCRRVRLLVSPDNARACALYARAGFRAAGSHGEELILELIQPERISPAQLETFAVMAAAAKARRVFGHRRLRLVTGPHPAWVIGVERGPPACLAVAAAAA